MSSSEDDAEVTQSEQIPLEYPVETADSEKVESRDNDESEEDFEVPARKGPGRPRKYPPGTTNYDMLKARRAIQEQTAVVPMKEYGLRGRRVGESCE